MYKSLLKNTGLVQCYSLGYRQVCCMPVFILLYSVIFCFACFAPPPPHPPPNIGLVQCFSLHLPSSLHPFEFLCFIQFNLLLLCVLCPTSSGLCSDFSPAPLEFARFIFCFVLFSFKFCWVLRSFPH